MADDLHHGLVDLALEEMYDWLVANPDDPAAPSIRQRADLSKATFDFGREWLSFGLYLFRKA